MSPDDFERLEYVDIYDKILRPFPENPKDHDLGALQDAMTARGFVTPMVRDERSGYLAEGHGRLELLRKMHKAGEPAPRRIKVDGARWLAPVVRGVSFKDLDELRAHVIAANRIGEGLWVNRLLSNVLTKLGDEKLFGTGFDAKDIVHFAALAKGAQAPGAFPTVDDNLPTSYCCPKCHHAWSGDPMAGKARTDAEPEPKPEKKARGRK